MNDAYAQQFTGVGGFTQIVTLPNNTLMAAGQAFMIMNNSNGSLTLNSGSGGLIQSMGPNSQVIVTALKTGPSLPTDWNAVSNSYYFQNGFRTNTTSQSLILSDAYGQLFTVGALTVTLPNNSLMGAGHSFMIMNSSTGNLTLNSGNGTLMQTIYPNSQVIVTAKINNALAPADWNVVSSGYTFQNGFKTQAAAGVLTSLLVNSEQVQQFTGAAVNQIVALPTTNVGPGQTFVIMNNTAGNIILKSSAGVSPANTIQIMGPNTQVMVTSLIAAPTLFTDWSAVSSSYTFQNGFRTQGTGSPVALLVNDAYIQQFTGAGSPTVTLPGPVVGASPAVAAGQSFLIMNNSTGTLTLNANGGGLIQLVGPNSQVLVTALQYNPSLPSHWNAVSNSYYFQNGFRTQAPALNTTTTLTVSDAYVQQFTAGAAGQIVQLPTTTVAAGQSFIIMNNSANNIT
jgi:hypothetical protein